MQQCSSYCLFISLLIGLAVIKPVNGKPPGWTLVQNGTTGLVANGLQVVSPTLAVMFQRAANDPLMINNHSAWGALWDFRTNTASALDLRTNAFCGATGFLSNGTTVAVAGHPPDIYKPPSPPQSPAEDGRKGVRMFEPCTTPDGAGCTMYDDPEMLHLAENRWYPTGIRIFDGSLMVVGGNTKVTGFYNVDPFAVNSIEFVPPKDNGVPRPSPFLVRTMPANMYPRSFTLPDGKILMIANNQTIIYDVENDTEQVLPEIPNGVRVTNPFDGTGTLLPLSPPDYIPEVFVCGGTNISDTRTLESLSKQDPASDQCSRLVITPEGIKRGWQVEKMIEGRIMLEMILLPDGRVAIVNGAQTGYPAFGSVQGTTKETESNADHPAFTPVLYTPDARPGMRFSKKGMPTTQIPRLYHSTATLTPMGNIMLAGQNPHLWVINDTEYPSEFRAEYLNPPYMLMQRPVLSELPPRVEFNSRIAVSVSIPRHLDSKNFKVALMDLGSSTHGWHSNSLLVWMVAKLSVDKKTLTFTTPPNNRVYPPGPAFVFLTVDGVTSEGAYTLVGNGLSPPVRDQGVPL